jgi:hypothetical protein
VISLISGNMRGDLMGLVVVGEDVFMFPSLIVLHKEGEFAVVQHCNLFF